MNDRRVCLLGAVFALAVATGGCRNGDRSTAVAAKLPPKGEWKPTREAEIFYTTEVVGYVEPCGCTSDPLGGLPRLATVLRDSDVEHGLVDVGNLLFPSGELEPVTREQHVLKSRILARGYRRMGALALNIAQADLHEGVTHLAELQREGAVPFVSANVHAKDGGPEIARSYVRTLGSIRFGITGVATPERVAAVTDEVTVLEYAPSLRNEVRVLREQGAEVVVVLAHVGGPEALQLARLVPEADLVLYGPGTPIERTPNLPKRVGPVIVAEAGSQGQHVGRISFAFDDATPGRPLSLDDGEIKQRRRRALDARKLAAFEMERDAWSHDPSKADAVRAKEAQIARLKAHLEQPPARVEAMARPHLKIDLVPLSQDIEENVEVREMLAGYYQQLQKMNRSKGDPAACAPEAGEARFVGTRACVECHEDAYAFWEKTKHALAWETLEEDGKHFDLTCVGCHVVGWQRPGGVCRLTDVQPFVDVGCESCHGPGSAHVEGDGDLDAIQLESSPQTCAGVCHVPEHSDGFVYEKYLREVTGPGHELSED